MSTFARSVIIRLAPGARAAAPITPQGAAATPETDARRKLGDSFAAGLPFDLFQPDCKARSSPVAPLATGL
jgi:hypothetical protein